MDALCRLFPIRRDWKAELKKPSPGPLRQENLNIYQFMLFGEILKKMGSAVDSPFIQHNKMDSKYCNIE